MKRKIYQLFSGAKQLLFALSLSVCSGTAYSQTTYTFNYTGSTQSISLAAGNYSIQCWGADGGWGGDLTSFTGTNGIGGYSSGVYTVITPTILYIYVGGRGQTSNITGASIISAAGGWNGGGGGRNGSANTYWRGGGGGGTDVRTSQNAVYLDRVIVAGGGGGAGGSSGTPLTWVGSGGNGGGLLGQDGVLAGSQTTHNGKGGTQAAGGAGGVQGANLGLAGTFGIGGDGGGTSNAFPAGGGGGGWYGGGGGAVQGGSGAGGSSYLGGVTSGTTIMKGQAGFPINPTASGTLSSDGYVLIKEMCSITLSVSGLNANGGMCPGNSLILTSNAIANYSWTTGSNAPLIIVSPTTNTVYGLTAMSPSNCMTSAQVFITVSPAPVINITNNNPIVCKGSQAMISASGANTYTWSTGSTVTNITVLPTQMTTYSVTGTYSVSNCSTTETTTVDVFTPTVGISGNNSICAGNTATLTANAAGATGYSWSTGLPIQWIIVAPSFHTIYVATANVPTLNISCVATNSVLVTVKPNPNIVPIPNMLNMCVNETVAFSATGGTAYAWSWASQTSNSPSITVTPTVITTLIMNVTGTGTNGCTNTGSVMVIVSSCTGIDEASSSNNSIQIYPNPSQGDVNVSFDAPAQLLLINETGQVVRKLDLNEENNYKVSVSGLSNGIYFITGQNGTRNLSKKVIVNR